MYEKFGDFAEDKDGAALLRKDVIIPFLKQNSNELILDFEGINLTTQSFIHALISNPLRQFGEKILERMIFLNCGDVVRGIIATVVQYSLDTGEISDQV